MTSFKDIKTRIQRVLEAADTVREPIKFPKRRRNNPSELTVKRVNFSGYFEYCEKPDLVYRAGTEKEYDFFLYVGNRDGRIFSIIVLFKKHKFSGEFAYLIDGVQLSPEEGREVVIQKLLPPKKSKREPEQAARPSATITPFVPKK